MENYLNQLVIDANNALAAFKNGDFDGVGVFLSGMEDTIQQASKELPTEED